LPDEIVEEVEDDILKQQREKDVEEDDERLDRGLDVL
jgi:predicted nucleic acid-binding protein